MSTETRDVEGLVEVAKFLRCCRGTEPAEYYEDAARSVEQADTALRTLREQVERLEQQLTQQLACIQIIAQGDEPNIVADFPAAEDVRRLRSRAERAEARAADLEGMVDIEADEHEGSCFCWMCKDSANRKESRK